MWGRSHHSPQALEQAFEKMHMFYVTDNPFGGRTFCPWPGPFRAFVGHDGERQPLCRRSTESKDFEEEMKGEYMSEKNLSRRSFIKTTGALGALAVAGGSVAATDSLFGYGVPQAHAAADEKTVWSHCNVNCGGRCVFQMHVTDGEIAYFESDNTGDDKLQSRACLRGRSMRRWVNSPDRLQYPMKRVGKRGEGKFERIGWDEAVDTIAQKLKGTIDKYGNEAVYINYATGMYAVTGRCTERFMNLIGGNLGMYGSYSTAQLTTALPFTYGDKNYSDASALTEACNADLLVMFGNSPAETRMGGANTTYDLEKVREAGTRIVNIDYRLNESAAGHADEWLPIRPGTDAALCSAIAYELIKNDKVDIDFLHKYCVGYDEETLPDAAKGQHASYKDYILGQGADGAAKTAEWASPITQIPVDTIKKLAQDIANAKPCYICQGWGPQRHANGELECRAIAMLPILTGNVGLPGTNPGMREGSVAALVSDIPKGTNPVATMISCFMWTDAIDHGDEMTATHDGVRGKDKLSTGIKFLWNYAGNCLTNQHGQINRTHEILTDETKCEFIVVSDTVMTDSAKYADILLPDVMRTEQVSMSTNGYSENYYGVIFGQKARDPKFECKTSYDLFAELADRFGVKDKFTEGRTQEDWIKYLYAQGAAKGKAKGFDMPSYDDGVAMGVWKHEPDSVIGLKKFRDDPVANALSTPSGKIEVYSAKLADMKKTWQFDDSRDFLDPLPVYAPGYNSYEDTTDEFPLVVAGFHHKSRTHSSFGFIDVLEQAAPQEVWINPVDAAPRGISAGDLCRVKNQNGEIEIHAKVTSRIIPGIVAVPQGAWHDADMNGDKVDKGGCINTLTTIHPSPLAKGNAVHNNIGQIVKA